MIWLYLDDERNVPKNFPSPVNIVRDYQSAINTIDKFILNNIEFSISFDHDLGLGASGYDVAKYIVENKIPMTTFHLHTMNPVGRENIRQLLSHYGYKETYLIF